MFKTKELIDLTFFKRLRLALNLEWTKGAFGFGVVLDGTLKNFAIHVIILKFAVSVHAKWLEDCKTC